MLFILVVWLYVALVSYIFGSFLTSVSLQFLRISAEKMEPVPLISLIGLGYLSVLCNILSLWIPMRLAAHLVVGGVALIFLGMNYRYMLSNLRVYFGQFSSISWVFLFIFGFFVVLQSVPISYLTDENSYYIQTLLWMEQYPVIPGLGNIAPCYAYNSSWHMLCAFFRLDFLGFHNLFNDLNGYLYLMIFLYILPSVQVLAKGKLEFSGWIKISFLILGYFLLRGAVVTINTDAAVAFFIWLICTLWLEYLLNDKQELSQVYILQLSLFAFTIKLSAILLTLIPFYWFLKSIQRGLNKKVVFISLTSLLFCLPYFTRNVITSGYLLSPLTTIDIFEVDWKTPRKTEIGGLIGVEYLLEPYLTGITHQRALLEDENGELTITGDRLSFKELIQTKIEALNFYSGTFVFCMFLVGIIHAILWIRKPVSFRRLSQKSDFRFLFGFSYLGILFLIFLLPSWKSADFRIGLGYLLFYVSSTLPVCVYLIPKVYEKRIAYASLLFVGLLLVKSIYNVEDNAFLIQHHGGYPPEYPQTRTKKTNVGQITFYVAIQDVPRKSVQCWGSPIPCYSEYPAWLEARGTRLEDGFRWKKDYKK